MTDASLRKIAEAVALDAAHIEEAKLIRTRKGCPTDIGFLCFKVAPPLLIERSKLSIGGWEVLVVPLNREASCPSCSGKYHIESQCPNQALKACPHLNTPKQVQHEEGAPDLRKDSPHDEDPDSDSLQDESPLVLKPQKKAAQKRGGGSTQIKP